MNTFGAIAAFLLAVVFILRNVPVGYGMMGGAFIGALLGGVSIDEAVRLMMNGAKEMTPSILRVLAAGVLAGVLMQSGAAVAIAEKLMQACGEKYALFSLCVAAMMLTACGVFVDVAIMTIAPVALAMAHRLDVSRFAILLALIGGGKAGNIISPNPNTIAAAEAFHVPLSSLMMAGIAPAVIGLFVTYQLAKRWRGDDKHMPKIETVEKETPPWQKAIVAPGVAIILLLSRPLFGVSIDPLIALPTGAVIGVIVMNKTRELNVFLRVGMEKNERCCIHASWYWNASGCNRELRFAPNVYAHARIARVSAIRHGIVSWCVIVRHYCIYNGGDSCRKPRVWKSVS